MPTRFVTNPGRPGRKPLRRPARSQKNPAARRIGGVEAVYMGRVAGASRAVDGDGVEYRLDPEAVAEMGLRNGDMVVVRAVPGRFATFRKTVARKNPAHLAPPGLRALVEKIQTLTDENAHTQAVETLAVFAFPDKSHRMRKVIHAAAQLHDAYGYLPPGIAEIRDEVYKNAIQSIRREHGANVASQLAQAF